MPRLTKEETAAAAATAASSRSSSSSNSSMNSNTVTTPPSSPVKPDANAVPPQQQRSLHSPVPRTRLGSKDMVGTTATAAAAELSWPQLTMTTPESPTASTTTTAHRRTRFNSRDLPRSYAGQYANSGGGGTHHHADDMLPLECLRSQQIVASKVSFVVFLSTYLTLVLALQFFTTTLLFNSNSDTRTTSGSNANATNYSILSSWTVTNAVHCLVTIAYLHWSKGSYLLDEQGELNAMTVWEQLEATTESTAHMRRTLLVIPTALAYAACVTSNFAPGPCLVNVVLWCISMLAKLPAMNGVRLFGINRTAGIDDDDDYMDDNDINSNNNNNGGTASSTATSVAAAAKNWKDSTQPKNSFPTGDEAAHMS